MPDVTPTVSVYVTGSYGGGSTSTTALGTKDWYEALMLSRRPDGSAAILDLRVTGHVTGRVRRDGRIDLAVDVGRTVGVRGSRLASGYSGRTQLTVDENETVEFQPPPLHGTDDGPYADVLRAGRRPSASVRDASGERDRFSATRRSGAPPMPEAERSVRRSTLRRTSCTACR